MQPRRSAIFEAYAKLSEEKELLAAKKDKKPEKKEDKESKELKKYRSEAYARVGSDSIDIIEALYGVKPETIKGMEYEGNMVGLAHPNPVIIAPSYDKLNGLVENINERANIIHNKVMSKIPSGSTLLLKDAKKELALSLVRIGQDMDNENEDELRILADNCLDGLKKKADWMDDLSDAAHRVVNYIGGNKANKAVSDIGGIGEGALAGAAAGAGIAALLGSWTGPGEVLIIPAGALLGGLVGYLFNTSPKIKNIQENAKDLQDQLNDLKKTVPEEGPFFAQIEEIVARVVKSSNDYLAALNTVRGHEIRNEIATPQELDEVKKDTRIFIDSITSLQKVRTVFNSKVKEGAFAKALSSIPHPGIANDIEDVSDSFNTLSVAIDNLKSTMMGMVEKAKEETSKASEETKKEEKPTENFNLDHKPSKEQTSIISKIMQGVL